MAANRIADDGVPVIYVDSLPYLWTKPEELPAATKVASYCAQKFPTDRLPVSELLHRRHDVHWIDPIVPRAAHRRGGAGVVISVGGLHSHLVGDTVDAYLALVLLALASELRAMGWPVAAVCGNLPADWCRALGDRLPDCRAIGRQSPYDFERLLEGADRLITSPGSTTILQALSLKLPTLLLPPQNLSQLLNARLFSAPGAPGLSWPARVMMVERIEELRAEGEDAALSYIYRSISAAARSPAAAQEVAATIRTGLRTMPERGVLDESLATLGSNGAAQVAQLIKQAMLAPIPRRR